MPRKPAKSTSATAKKRVAKAKAPAKSARKTKPKRSENGFALRFHGSQTFGSLFVDSISGLDGEAEAIGYSGLDSSEARARMSAIPLPPPKPFTGPTAMAGPVALFMMEVIAFLAEPVTKALVEVVSGEFFKLVLPKIGKMFSKGKGERIEYPVIFRPAMFFQAEQVQVTALMTIRKAEDYKCAETLVPQAFERAVEWLSRNGRTAPYLTYRIDNCKLSSFPEISNVEPKA